MCTERDEADVTVSFAARIVECTDNTETSIFAGSPRIWLQRSSIESSNLAKIIFQLLKTLRMEFCNDN
jgi:hypothetical protein